MFPLQFNPRGRKGGCGSDLAVTKAVPSEAAARASWSQFVKESAATSAVPQKPSHNFPCRKDFTFYPFGAA